MQISDLKLRDRLLVTSKTSPAARNRYVYLDNRLINVQQGIFGMIQEPVLRQTLLEVWQTFFQYSQASGKDETIGQFLGRRGLKNTANNLVSAMIHGIYAGDINELSADSVFPTLRNHEYKYGSPWNFVKQQVLARLSGSDQLDSSSDPVEAANWKRLLKLLNEKENDVRHLPAMSASVYTLKGGLETLINALEGYLVSHPNVKLVTGATAQSIQEIPQESFSSSKNTHEKACNNYVV